MDETLLRRLLDDALAGEPPIGPVAANAERAGVIRRRRRGWAVAGSAVAVIIITAAVIPALAGTHRGRPAAHHQYQRRMLMPQVLGLSLRTAESKIRLVIARARVSVRRVESPQPGGKVIAQLPVIGAKVDPRTRVLLTLSGGSQPPPCPRRTGTAPDVIRIITRPGPPYFGRSCYYARAGQRLTISVTNHVHDLGDKKPTADTIAISPASNPAITAVPGQPGMAVGDFSRAVFVTPAVIAGRTRTFIFGPLPAGKYVMQIEQYGLESTVTLTVR